MQSTTNHYRNTMRLTCAWCEKRYAPCHPRQETCSNKCAATLGSRRRQSARLNTFTPLTIGGTVAVVPLTKGKYAIIDACDWHDVGRFNWYYGDDGRAARRGGKKIVRMHQQLLPVDPGMEVDHQNLNPLDNRKENLRPATSSEQKFNQSLKANNRSGFKGVSWDKDRRKWQAFVTAHGKRVTIGRFDIKEHAVICRRAVAQFIFGKFAKETA